MAINQDNSMYTPALKDAEQIITVIDYLTENKDLIEDTVSSLNKFEDYDSSLFSYAKYVIDKNILNELLTQNKNNHNFIIELFILYLQNKIKDYFHNTYYPTLNLYRDLIRKRQELQKQSDKYKCNEIIYDYMIEHVGDLLYNQNRYSARKIFTWFGEEYDIFEYHFKRYDILKEINEHSGHHLSLLRYINDNIAYINDQLEHLDETDNEYKQLIRNRLRLTRRKEFVENKLKRIICKHDLKKDMMIDIDEFFKIYESTNRYEILKSIIDKNMLHPYDDKIKTLIDEENKIKQQLIDDFNNIFIKDLYQTFESDIISSSDKSIIKQHIVAMCDYVKQIIFSKEFEIKSKEFSGYHEDNIIYIYNMINKYIITYMKEYNIFNIYDNLRRFKRKTYTKYLSKLEQIKSKLDKLNLTSYSENVWKTKIALYVFTDCVYHIKTKNMIQVNEKIKYYVDKYNECLETFHKINSEIQTLNRHYIF